MWFISSLLKILQGLPALPVEHMAWPSHVYVSLQHCPIEWPLPLHLPPLSPAFSLLSGFMITCPASLRVSQYPLSCFGLNALSSLLSWTHHHLELFQLFGFGLLPLWNKLHKVSLVLHFIIRIYHDTWLVGTIQKFVKQKNINEGSEVKRGNFLEIPNAAIM